MRHLLANIATYTIAAGLFIGAALFARMRESQYMLTKEDAVLAQFEPGRDFDWEALGPDVYRRNCMNCHARDGAGWDQYPPLAPAAGIAELPSGREYLIDLHLYGLASTRWRAPMPPMAHMHDVEIAAVLNHIMDVYGPPGDAPRVFEPGDVAERRGQRLRPRDVNERRPVEADRIR
jgi:mono/diheme cytochrome c family protein